MHFLFSLKYHVKLNCFSLGRYILNTFGTEKAHLEDIPKNELQKGLPEPTCKLLYCASFQGGCLIKEFAYGKNKDRYCGNR